MVANPSPSDAAGPDAAGAVVQLSPSYNVPIGLGLLALPLLLVSPWLSVAIALFACFLLFQAATLRLTFTVVALDIYRKEDLIRRFPYQDWQSWRIFWSSIPILFYFKEVNSIHFLPVLFNATQLQAALERHQLPFNPPSD
ncbi:MAG: DUF3119 family protein [Elainellaceae cyanobacterium]